MKKGMREAAAPKRITPLGYAKILTKVIGIGLAAGIALITVTDKTMSKAFPQEEKCEKVQAPEEKDLTEE